MIEKEAYTKLSTDLKESDAMSNLMEDFPPIYKQDPLDVQMNYIKDHFATTGKRIRLEDVLETMYGGALLVAKSRKTKRKALTEDEYLEDASEHPSKKSKKAKKEKASTKVNEVGPAVPTIQEEVQDLDADTVLDKMTRSGKVVSTSQAQPPQPSIPKKKRKIAVRKLKIAEYVSEDEEQIVAVIDVVTRELEKKKAEDVATFAKIRELAKGIEVSASSIERENAGIIAQEIVKVAEEVQELVTSVAGSLLMIVDEKSTEDAQKHDVVGSEAAASEATRGNPDSLHSANIIEIESSSESLMTVCHSTFLESFYDNFEFTSKLRQQEKQEK